jgi:protein SCO1/2
MRREQKIVLTIVWGLAVMMMLGLVALGVRTRAEPALPQAMWDVPHFSFTDQDGKTISDASMRDSIWVATVFFTQCPGVCPMMSARMAELQKNVPLPDVKIVSFSLDPEHDTPEIMHAYADRFGADSARWHMLTGEKQTLYDTAHGLRLVAEPAHDGQPILHTQKVLLVDCQNGVRGIYDTNDDDSMKLLARDARGLAQEQDQ